MIIEKNIRLLLKFNVIETTLVVEYCIKRTHIATGTHPVILL